MNRIPTRNFARALRLQKYGPDGWEDGQFREQPEYGDNMESFWWGETLKSALFFFVSEGVSQEFKLMSMFL